MGITVFFANFIVNFQDLNLKIYVLSHSHKYDYKGLFHKNQKWLFQGKSCID